MENVSASFFPTSHFSKIVSLGETPISRLSRSTLQEDRGSALKVRISTKPGDEGDSSQRGSLGQACSRKAAGRERQEQEGPLGWHAGNAIRKIGVRRVGRQESDTWNL